MRVRNRTFVMPLVAAAACAAASCAAGVDRGRADLYYGFAQLDPAAERIVEQSYIVVEDGRIVETGAGAPPGGNFKNRYDLSGRYALPGLIDAHAHIASGPHKVEVVDGAPRVTIESVDAITAFNARMALAFGVTTVRNPGGDPVANARYDENVANGDWIGPDALHAGAVIQPPPFVGGAFAYPQTEAEWDAEAARQASLGMTYFKLYTDLSEDELAMGVAAAHRHGLKAIAHLNAVSWTRAVELGVDGLEHALPTSPDLLEPDARAAYAAGLGPDSKFMYRWFQLADYDGPLMQSMMRLLAEKQTVLNLTLVVNELVYNADDLNRLFPDEDRPYYHPDNLNASLSFLAAGAYGWTADDFARARATMPKVLEFARRLHEAGAAMMIGTDGNGGGPMLAREMSLHVKAGIPVWDVLRMSTTEGARWLGLADRTGRLAEGLEADIVFFRSNPVDDVMNVRDVELVVTNGKAYRFEDLTAQPPGASE